MAHITEKHTYDKIFINIILLFFWINPFFWIIRKELNMIHEFVADKMALEDGDTNAFAEMILSSVYPGEQFPITNNFFYSPIKRRLLMLTKNKHAKVNYISRLLVLPLATIIFIGISCKVKTETESQKTPEEMVAIPPANGQTTLPEDSAKTLSYDNKIINGLLILSPFDNPKIELRFDDGSKEIITREAAVNAGLPIPALPPPATKPPSPPGPPVPVKFEVYNGKLFMFAVKSDANKVILNYPDGSQETITLEKAKKANLTILDPPKVEKDTNAQFTPPKVIKDKNVQFTPPKFVKLGSAGSLGGRISLKDIENAKKLEPGSNDYTIENFTVYFTGAGFPHVSFTQKGAIFSTELQKEWENIKPGTSISFDQVMIDYKGDQIKINNPPGYIVY